VVTKFILNGKAQVVDVDSSTPLLYVLRNVLGLRGPKFGCGLGQCGACTVIINGESVLSCVTPLASAKDEGSLRLKAWETAANLIRCKGRSSKSKRHNAPIA
jgi:aerobic-type carbon monoxide dehydrogenase small subunit (CoxS/CutS family)